VFHVSTGYVGTYSALIEGSAILFHMITQWREQPVLELGYHAHYELEEMDLFFRAIQDHTRD